MAEHVDNHLVENNLRSRFEYLSKFIHFTTDDISTLNNIAQMASELIPTIVDKIFQRLLDFDITKRYFLMRHFGYTGHVIVNESELRSESEQRNFRRISLGKYLKRILREKVWNNAFLEYLSYV